MVYDDETETYGTLLSWQMLFLLSLLQRSTMKTLLCYAFFLVTFAYNVHNICTISSLDDETYTTFLELLKGEFNVPLQKKSTKQKSAIVRFWGNLDHLFLQKSKVCFNVEPILCNSAVSKVVKKTFKQTKGSGLRKLYHRLKDVCSSVGERHVRSVLVSLACISG